MKGMEDNTFAEAFARIECHYFINNCFFPCEDYLLKEVHRIKDIPGIIVQGRYDVVCAPREAWKLSKAWPKAELCMIKDAGHSGSEPGIVKALVDYMDRIKK
jgi:proline iminopeptidase